MSSDKVDAPPRGARLVSVIPLLDGGYRGVYESPFSEYWVTFQPGVPVPDVWGELQVVPSGPAEGARS